MIGPRVGIRKKSKTDCDRYGDGKLGAQAR